MGSALANKTVPTPRLLTRGSLAMRLRGGAIAAAAVAALMLAGTLEPYPSGAGTHRQLHLPACSMLARTGWPCPTCGVTTSVAAMAHGDVLAALKAQPFGVVIFAATAALAVAGGFELVSAAPVFSRLRPRLWWALAAVGGILAGWATKLALGVATGELPIR